MFSAINTYTWNQTSHTKSFPDDILAVSYEDGKWSKPYYDCGGGNIWMLTYTVPFFAFKDAKYFFKLVYHIISTYKHLNIWIFLF